MSCLLPELKDRIYYLALEHSVSWLGVVAYGGDDDPGWLGLHSDNDEEEGGEEKKRKKTTAIFCVLMSFPPKLEVLS